VESEEYLLERITIAYSAFEDRLSLVAALNDDETVKLWLTQRFCAQLFPKLLEWVERQAGHTIATAAPASKGAAPQPQSDKVKAESLAFHQVSAQLQQKRGATVEAKEGSCEMLVTTVDVKFEAGCLRLIFPLDDTRKAIIPFSTKGLAQFLGVIFMRYGEARWPVNVWPPWFKRAQLQPSNAYKAELH
jgi:hypothetical protein